MDQTLQHPDVIKIEHLWAGYENEIILEDINLSIEEHDFLGIIGPNGGGKTTLIKIILGLMDPLKGQIKILGEPPKKNRHMVGYVPQSVAFDQDFPINVWDVVQMGRLGNRGLLNRFNAEDREIVAESLRQVGMLHIKNRPIGELSGGQRQRVYIARALTTRPKILILDEPTASVDAEASQNIYELLNELNQEVTILLVSHDMSAISSYTKSIGCLNRRFHYHGDKSLTPDMIQDAYNCPIDLIAHGLPHRVFPNHD